MSDTFYTVDKDRLDDIADAIRLKRDITDSMTLEDMPMQIGLIGGINISPLEFVSKEVVTHEESWNTDTKGIITNVGNEYLKRVCVNKEELIVQFMYIENTLNSAYSGNFIMVYSNSNNVFGVNVRNNWSNIGYSYSSSRSFYIGAGSTITVLTFKIH